MAVADVNAGKNVIPGNSAKAGSGYSTMRPEIPIFRNNLPMVFTFQERTHLTIYPIFRIERVLLFLCLDHSHNPFLYLFRQIWPDIDDDFEFWRDFLPRIFWHTFGILSLRWSGLNLFLNCIWMLIFKIRAKYRRPLIYLDLRAFWYRFVLAMSVFKNGVVWGSTPAASTLREGKALWLVCQRVFCM